MSIRSRGFKSWLRQGLVVSLLALLAACGTTGVNPPSASDNGYLLTVKISSTDTQSSIAQKYGGQTIAWQPQGGFAILKMSKQAVTQMKSSGISLQDTTLDANSNMAPPEDMDLAGAASVSGQSTANTAGWNTWAGGWNTWAGGWNTWAGGWNTWAGGTGTVPTLPSNNRFDFLLTKLPQAQALARNYGAGVTVAVIDTGIDLTHPMFSGRLAPSSTWKDYVDGDTTPQEATGTMYGHGTAVAGLILQVAPLAKIMPIRVLDGSGGGDVANVVTAVQWAMTNGANVINLSLGTTDNNAALQSMINSANAAGIYVVASAGNTGNTNMTYPAAWAKTGSYAKYLLSAGSINPSMSMSSFCSTGTALEFLAVGEGIASAYPGNQAASYNGTSFAAPQVSGALALALSDTAAANKGNLESYLSNSGTAIGSYKLINTMAFLQQLPDFVKRNALFVIGQSSPNASDNGVLSRLQSLGYAVTLGQDSKLKAPDLTGIDVVVISSTIDPAKLGSVFQNVSVPVVSWESAGFATMGMTSSATSSYGVATSQTQSTILSTTHPLAAGYAPGNQTVYTGAVRSDWGTPGSGAVVAATIVGASSQATVFGYDTGSQMVGMTAPARRVGFFLFDDTSAQLSTAGWQLFDSAITWAVSGN